MIIELKTVINFFNDTNCSHFINKEIVELYCNYGTFFTQCFKKEITKYLNTNNYIINTNNHSKYIIKSDNCYQHLQLTNQLNSSDSYNSSIMINYNINNMNDIIIYMSMFVICIVFTLVLIYIVTNKFCFKKVSFRKNKRYRNVNLFVNDYEDY